MTELQIAEKNYREATAAWDANKTPETQAAVKAAWAAYDAAGPRRKVSGYASRAGKRQARERGWK